jgi:nucleoside triphosphate pyrophosphatase
MMPTPGPMVYLASRSPRRQELLRQLGVGFETLKLREASGRQRDVIEIAHDGEPALHYVERIARTKAMVGAQQMVRRGLAPRPVLGADTEVVLDGEIFGKPRDDIDAARMLTLLSGRTHDVLTAVAVSHEKEAFAEIAMSAVTFRALSPDEIDRYVATGEPVDKAGAYAIQGRAAAFANRLVGSYSGVMGLPLFETAAILARVGVRVL